MRLFGDNSKYGDTEIELADGKRTVGVKVEDGKAFPEGVAGLIPVVTKRKKGGTKTVYAFPTKEGDSGELEQTDELAVITDGVDLINRLLAQAAELARIELGQIFGVTRERIRQIENKAIRKLRHPSRAKKIRDFYC